MARVTLILAEKFNQMLAKEQIETTKILLLFEKLR
jgi:hypothetical protein